MKKIKTFKTSRNARKAADNGVRPMGMWTKYTVLIEVKRKCPHLFDAAKQLSEAELLGAISPYLTDRDVHTWVDGRKGHLHFSPWRLMEKLGLHAEAKDWRREHNGRDW